MRLSSSSSSVCNYLDLKGPKAIWQQTPSYELVLSEKTLQLSRPLVMGILNLTPDSFADGGQYHTTDLALERVEQMLHEGADMIDIGAESSRPFAQKVPLSQELDRLMNVLTAVKARFDTVISVDTYKPEVMKEAITQGVHLVNDIYALSRPGALEAVAASSVGVCLMHMQKSPDSMQQNPHYRDVLTEVRDFLNDRALECLAAGISANRVIVDPGFGFGKTTPHNLLLLNNLSKVSASGFPILAGLSRKASIGEILALPVEQRLYGSIAAHVIAVLNGAAIVRTHDVKPTVEALKIATAVIAGQED